MSYADAINGTDQSQLSGILAALNRILTPTEKLPESDGVARILLGAQPQNTQRASMPASGGSSGPPSTGNTLSQYESLAKNIGNLKNLLGTDPANGIPAGQTSVLDSLNGANPFAGPGGSAPIMSSIPAAGLPFGMAPAVGGAPTAAELATTQDALAPFTVGGSAAAALPLGMAPAVGAAPTAAELATTAPALTTPIATGAPAAAAPAASAAPSALSTAGYAMAGPAAFAAMYLGGNALNAALNGPNNNWSIGTINNLINGVKSGGPNMNAGSVMNANGSINQGAAQSLADLAQLQDGYFGNANSYVAKTLNGMGYQTLGQQVAANGGYVPTPNGGGGQGGYGRLLLQKS